MSPCGTARSDRPLQAFPPGAKSGSLPNMTDSTEQEEAQSRITPRLIDGFYTEAMILADEARAYFDDLGRADRLELDPFARVGFACESLKVTTRIMHIVAWLLTQRAVESGEIYAADQRRP